MSCSFFSFFCSAKILVQVGLQLCGLIDEALGGVGGGLAGEVVDRIRRGFVHDIEPLLACRHQLFEDFANVGVSFVVVVEIVLQLVDEPRVFLEKLAYLGRLVLDPGVADHLCNGIGALPDEFHVELDAFGRLVGDFAELIDLGFGERVVFVLGRKQSLVRPEEKEQSQQTESQLVTDAQSPGRCPAGVADFEEIAPCPLLPEDLKHQLRLHLIELLEGGVKSGSVFERGLGEHVMQAEGGVAHQNLGVLEPLAVVGHIHVNLGCVLLDRADGARGLFDLARGQLSSGELGHLVDKLRVEKALLARPGLAGARLEGQQRLGIRDFFIDGAKAGGGQKES